MATLTAPELTNLRTTTHRATPYLSVFKPVTLLGALVNNGSPTRGMRTIAYDNGTGTGYATITAGQTLEVDTATGTRRVRIKAITGNQTTGTITVAENSIVWGNNQTLRVLHHYDLWGIPPRISGGIFYKDFDIIYSNQNSLPNPVAIAGPMRAGFLSAGTIAFTIDASPSYAITNGATIAGYAWSCVHNGGGTTGITITNAAAATTTLTITVADSYWLTLTVTDSNGKTQTTHRLVFVYDSGSPPYVDFNISSVSGDWSTGGYQFGISAVDGLSLDDLPDRTPVLLWYANRFGSTAGFVNVWDVGDNILCAGYFRNDSDNDNLENGTAQTDFTVTSADGVMDNIVELGSISINSGASVTRWYEYATWLTIGRGVHHLLKWHSTVLECVDVYGLTDNTTGVKVCDFTEPTLLQQANSLSYGRGIFAKLVSDRPGRLHLVEDSQMLNTTNRAALDTVCTLALADLSGVVTVARQTEERTATAELNGFSWDGATGLPFIACLPGYIESSVSYLTPEPRGAASANINGQVLIDQTDANERVGRILAADNNNPQEIRITNQSNYSGAFDIVPSIGFYEWGIADNVFGRALELNGLNLICRRIDNAVNVTGGIIQTSVVFEPEAIGPDGIPGNYPTGYPTPPFRIPPTEDDGGGGGGGGAEADVIAVYDGSTRAKVLQYTPTSPGVITQGFGVEIINSSGGVGVAAALSTSKAIVARSGDVFLSVAEVSGSSVNNNTVYIPYSGYSSLIPISLAALSSSQALIAASNGVNQDAFIGDISGTVITSGSITTLTGALGLFARLSSSSALYAFDDGQLKGAVISVSGSSVIENTPVLINASNPTALGVIVFDSDNAVICGFFGGTITAYPITGITTTFTAGAGVNITTTSQRLAQYSSLIAKVSDSLFVCSYIDTITEKVTIALCSYTAGVIVVEGTTDLTNLPYLSGILGVADIVALSSDVVMVTYLDIDTTTVRMETATISGTTITAENNTEAISGGSLEGMAVLRAVA